MTLSSICGKLVGVDVRQAQLGNEQLVFKGDVPLIIKWNLPFNVCRRRASGICPSMFAGDAPLEFALQCLQATRLWNLPFNVCRRRASDHKVEFALQCLRTCNGKKTTTKHTVTNIEGRFPLYGGSALVAECLSKIPLRREPVHIQNYARYMPCICKSYRGSPGAPGVQGPRGQVRKGPRDRGGPGAQGPRCPKGRPRDPRGPRAPGAQGPGGHQEPRPQVPRGPGAQGPQGPKDPRGPGAQGPRGPRGPTFNKKKEI